MIGVPEPAAQGDGVVVPAVVVVPDVVGAIAPPELVVHEAERAIDLKCRFIRYIDFVAQLAICTATERDCW